MHETHIEPAAFDSPSASGRGKHPNSRKNLIPFTPGHSGNPSGLCKDGSSPKGRSLRASLLEHLEKPGAMDAIAKRWLRAAMQGSFPHLNAILERLYPTEETGQGTQLLEGIKLELTESGASVSILRASGASSSGATREDAAGTPGGIAPGSVDVASGPAGEFRSGTPDEVNHVLVVENAGAANGVVLAAGSDLARQGAMPILPGLEKRIEGEDSGKVLGDGEVLEKREGADGGGAQGVVEAEVLRAVVGAGDAAVGEGEEADGFGAAQGAGSHAEEESLRRQEEFHI